MQVRCWLSLPLEVAEAAIAETSRRDAVGELSFDALPSLLRAACDAAGDAGQRVDIDELLLRFGARRGRDRPRSAEIGAP